MKISAVYFIRSLGQVKRRMMMLISVLLTCAYSFAQFTDESSNMGINHVFIGGGYGGGVSVIDINGDGLDDLTLGTGTGFPLEIYYQTEGGLELQLDPVIISITQAVRSINWVDYDNDGDKDLFFTTAELPQYDQHFKLYQQQSDGEFIDVTQESGIDPDYAYSFGSAWADYNKDGFLDLYVSTRTIGPNGANYMYKNQGDGTFIDVAEELGLQDIQGHSFTSVFFDADMDGNIDLFTANDRTNSFNRFYIGNSDGTFTDYSEQSNLYICMDAMGAEVGDYDGDGDFDIYVTNTSGGILDSLVGNLMFRNEGGLQFTAISNFPYDADIGSFWGCSLFDYDHDMDFDLFTVATWVDPPYTTSEFFFENEGGGSFSAYQGDEFDFMSGFHYASAHGDLNNDGWTDIVVGDQYIGNSQIWMASPGTNNWLKLHLQGTVSNRDAIGAVIEVWTQGVKQIDMTTCGNSYISQDSDTYPFGLGTNEVADSVIIYWPNGHMNIAYDLAAGERHIIVEDTSTYAVVTGQNCADVMDAPVGLASSFKPVEDIYDRLQLYWYKGIPDIRFSDEDAASCDIKYWPRWNLDPLSGETIGNEILLQDTAVILDAKKFHLDGSPRSIYKWPVKFRSSPLEQSRRIDPNIRYEWQVRCACGHGSGPESMWSASSFFDSPDFNPSTGQYDGIPPLANVSVPEKSQLRASRFDFEIYPNPVSSGIVHVKVKSMTSEVIRYHLLDLTGRSLEDGILEMSKGNESRIELQKRYGTGSYILLLFNDLGESSRMVTLLE
ncbi:MAG: CRTAC1 family protein [Flavobacteriales bacterium]|nr:CRTAC1 family protein [Flavobacteriales bacterium]